MFFVPCPSEMLAPRASQQPDKEKPQMLHKAVSYLQSVLAPCILFFCFSLPSPLICSP